MDGEDTVGSQWRPSTINPAVYSEERPHRIDCHQRGVGACCPGLPIARQPPGCWIVAVCEVAPVLGETEGSLKAPTGPGRLERVVSLEHGASDPGYQEIGHHRVVAR